MLRTHKLNELNKKLAGENVTLCGWVDTVRDHGNVVFIDLRDRYGKIQCVVNKKNEFFSSVKELSIESCISLKGLVRERPRGTVNEDVIGGDIEVSIESIEVFNKCPPLPFEFNREDLGEDVRLKYRFLDLRGDRMNKIIRVRSDTLKSVRDFFYDEGFIEIETPILGKSTPEGARDFLVPSRKEPGKVYALPQSPQLFKQLSQVAGFDKYIQLARCFRDEDSRKDRQPEFTQIDVEMSFIDQEDMIDTIERMLKKVFKEVLDIEIKTPFQRIPYDEAMEKYGSDRPDLRKNKDDPNEFAFCWVVDFPLFEYSEEEKRHKSTHHPFTMPAVGKNGKLDFDEKSKSIAYDVVLNGSEIGGGSIRIHDEEIQKKIFDLLKISNEEAENKFGFLLKALSFGAPSHGGLAIGFDRLIQLMVNEKNIREVIAFPKNSEGRDVMLEAPAEVSKEQLEEVGLEIKKK